MLINCQLTLLAILSIISGFAFAVLAVHLTTTQGNTIEAAQRSAATGQPVSLRLSMPGGWSMSAGTPIVALYTISAICVFALPVFYLFETRIPKGTSIMLHGVFSDAPAHVRIISANAKVTGAEFFIPFDPLEQEPLFIADATPELGSVTIEPMFHADTNTVTVKLNATPIGTWAVDANYRVEIPPANKVPLNADIGRLPHERSAPTISSARTPSENVP